MADNRNGCSLCRTGSSSSCGESVIIDTNHVFDSCRDRDCFEDVAVFLSPEGQELIERTTNVRVCKARILFANITVDPVQFNRGFYEIKVRFYVKLELEACVCLGRPAGFCGIAVVEKSVVLYGSEGNVNVFKSNSGSSGFCNEPKLCDIANTLPTAVVEVVDPVVLNVRVAEDDCCGCSRCCSCDDIPEQILCTTNGQLVFNDDGRHLLVSLGFFSVIRLERPAQFLVNASEYNVPDKECVSSDSDSNPCDLFRSMDFPITEFQPVSINTMENNRSESNGRSSCGCRDDK
ncbi:MAG: hypothetical protein IJ391_05260 [Clostridia bacterium]|nr:hypothetical protein [Clostridia bacterium]